MAEEKKDFNIKTEDMAKAGLHFGHKSSKIHPKMQPFLYGVRNGINVIDLDKTKENLEKALVFITSLILERKALLLIGTNVQAKRIIEECAKECGLPYVSERWLGGTFTNFEVIKKRIDRFKDLQGQKERGELGKYTKKERLKIDAEILGFAKKLGGIKDLTKLPDAIFIADIKKDEIAAKEARKKGVQIIAVSDSNNNPSLADYPIPANNDAVSSIKYILEKIKETILKAKEKVKPLAEKESK